jgi:hypothetical protein
VSTEDMPFWAYVVGMASILAMMIGFGILLIGALAEIPPLVKFGFWSVVGGGVGFVLLVIGSDRL